MEQHHILRLLLVRGLKTVFLVGGLGVENHPNDLREVAILLRVVSFCGVCPNGKYAIQKPRIRHKLKEQIRDALSLFLLASQKKWLSLCL
jgi:hypothetical protein